MTRPALTIARLTGSGPGAVAVYRLSGPNAAEIIAEKIRLPGGRFLSADQWRQKGSAVPKRPIFAHLLLDWSVPASSRSSGGVSDSVQNPPAEEVVLTVVDSETIEIDTHGGDSIAAAVFRTMERAGAVRINPLEPPLLKNTASEDAALENTLSENILSGAESFIQTAERLLPQVRTDWGAEILLDQCSGAAERFFRELDESVRSGAVSSAEAADALDRAADTAVIGTHLIEPFHVILAGPVNAGKSTLFNALLGFDRAIADQTPGTTRDLLFADTAFDGIPVRLYDTAGLRTTSDPIEQSGIQTAAERLSRADLVLLLSAASDKEMPAAEEEPMLLPDIPPERILRLLTKCDLLSDSEHIFPENASLNAVQTADAQADVYEKTADAKADAYGKSGEEKIPVSAFDSVSVSELQKRIVRRLILAFPPDGSPIALTAEQTAFYRALSRRFRTGKPLSNTEKASIIKMITR